MNIFNLFSREQRDVDKRTQNITNSESAGSNEPLETKATKANKIFVDNANKGAVEQYLVSYRNADLVFSCVNYIADICSQVKLNIYTKDKNNELQEIKNKKVAQWFKQPNPFQSMPEIISLYIQSYLLAGNAYLTFEKVGVGYEGWVLAPNKVKIVPDAKKYITGYIYDEQIAYKDTEIIFFKNSTLSNEYYGQSYLAALVDPLAIEGYAIDDLQSFYKNSLIAQGIFSSEYPLSQKQIDSLRAQFRALYGQSGSDRHGHLILPNNMKYQPIRINPKDGMLLEALGIAEDRIYKVFRIPPILLGGGKEGSVNGTEINAYKQLFVNNFIRPLLYKMTKQWEAFFRRVLRDENIVIIADYDEIPEVNTVLEEKIDAVKQAVSIGLLSINEGRNAVGYDKLDGAYTDTHLAASFLFGNTPIDLVSGEQLNLAPTNQQPKPQGSTNNDGGNPDGVSR